MGESGRKPKVTDEEMLAIFKETDERVLSTAEVSDELPITRRATLDRLTSLAEDGRVESKSIGQRNRVWWVPEGASRKRSKSNHDETDEPEKGALDF